MQLMHIKEDLEQNTAHYGPRILNALKHTDRLLIKDRTLNFLLPDKTLNYEAINIKYKRQ